MQNISPFDRVLSIGEILDRTFRLYRNKLGVLALTAAALLIPLGILNVIVVGSTMLDDLAGFGAVGSLPTSSSTIGEGLIGLLSILGAIAAAVTTLALTHQGSGLLHGKIPSLGESLGIGFRRFFGYMLMGLLQGSAILVVMAGGMVLVFIVITIADDSIIGAILAGLFFFALFALAIYLWARWFVSVPAFIDQNMSAVEALGYSWELTKGYVWRAIFFAILLGILNMVILVLPATLLALSTFLLTDTPAIFVTFTSALEEFVNVLWLPLYTLANLLFYFDLRVRNHGYDIEQRVAKFEYDAGVLSAPNKY